MDQQTIVITGTSSGFGFESAQNLATGGHRVFATMRNAESGNKPAAEQLQTFASEHDFDLTVLDLDVTSNDSVNAAIEQIIDSAGPVEILINNAGVMPLGVTEAFSTEQLTACLDTNVVGYFRLIKAVLPSMRSRQSGLILNIGSISGRIALPYEGIYNASKFAVEGLSEALRYELSSFGIDVVVIEPGPFETKLVGNSPNPENQTIVDSYGDAPIENVQKIEKAFEQMVADDQLPTESRFVVEAIRRVVETPVGDRPLRVTVGADLFVESINKATAPLQMSMMRKLEVDHLSNVKTARAALSD